MSRTRIGVVGAGFIARHHVEGLLRFDDVTVVGVADPVRERADELAALAGAGAFTTAEEMVDRAEPDALYVCVPPFAHGDPEALALERGLPFFVEKPLAADLRTAEGIAEEVARKGIPTAVGYHWRYLSTTEIAQELLAATPARLALGYWLDSTPVAGWWRRRALSGGQIVEQTTHVIDLARLLVGEIADMQVLVGHTPRDAFPDMDVADVTAAAVRFESGAVGTLASTCLLHWRHRAGLHLFGDGLAIELSEFDMVVDVGKGRPVTEAVGDPFEREDRAFIDAVRGQGDRIRVPYAEALRTHRLACALDAAAAEGLRPDRGSDAASTPARASRA